MNDKLRQKNGIAEEDFNPVDNEGFILELLADHELRVCELELGINEEVTE